MSLSFEFISTVVPRLLYKQEESTACYCQRRQEPLEIIVVIALRQTEECMVAIKRCNQDYLGDEDLERNQQIKKLIDHCVADKNFFKRKK